MNEFEGINWKEWSDYFKSIKGYFPNRSYQHMDFTGFKPDYIIQFFNNHTSLYESFFNFSDEKKIGILKSHNFITYKDQYIEKTHSLGHICEDNIFSPEDGEDVGCNLIALERMHFNYLTKELKFSDELYETWRDAVFISWGYFYLPDLLPDLKVITEKEPELAQGHYYLAECFQYPGNDNLDLAIKSYEKFLELSAGCKPPLNNYFISENFYRYFMYTPSPMEAYSGLARIFLSKGDLESYEESLLKSIESDKYHHAAPYLDLAYFYFQSGKIVDALKYVYIFEDVFEAKVRSFEFAEEFYIGYNLSRDTYTDVFYSKMNRWEENSQQTDGIKIGEYRLWWRFRKYPYLSIKLLSIKLHGLERPRKGHKNFSQVSYKDVYALIDSFYINILYKFLEIEKKYYPLGELFEKVKNKKSYTWDCFPNLKRFDEEKLIEKRLEYLIRHEENYESLILIKELYKKKLISEETLIKYKNRIFEASPDLKRYRFN